MACRALRASRKAATPARAAVVSGRAVPWIALLAYLTCATFALPQAAAATYFVSDDGDDTLDGRGEVRVGASGPWKSLSRLGLAPIQPGDRVLFRCGDRFSGSIVLHVQGGRGPLSTAGGIAFGAYGDCRSGAQPVLDGAMEVRPKRKEDGLWVVQSENATSYVEVDGVEVPEAATRGRTRPSAGDPQPPVADQLSLAQFGEAALQPVVGSRLTIRTRDWLVEELEVAALAGDRLRLVRPPKFPLVRGLTWTLTRAPSLLGAGNTGWTYDPVSKSLLIRRPSASWTSVRISQELPLLKLRATVPVVIEDLRFENAGMTAVDVEGSADVSLKRLVISNARRHAVHVAHVRQAAITDVVITGTGGDAVILRDVEQALVQNSVVKRSGASPILLPSVAAITLERVAKSKVVRNVVDGASYVGIRFGEGAVVEGNLLLNTCLRLSDCGAIYTWQVSPARAREVAFVRHNVIIGVYGESSVKLGSNVYAVGV